jgi:glutaredoxin
MAKSGKNKTITFRKSEIAQYWLVVSDGCPFCAETKENLMDEINSGEIRAVDIEDIKGTEIINELGINEVPVLVVEMKPTFSSRSGNPRYILVEG